MNVVDDPRGSQAIEPLSRVDYNPFTGVGDSGALGRDSPGAVSADRQTTRRGLPAPVARSADNKEWSVQIKISARHGHLPAEVHAIIEEKAEKLLHIFDRITMIQVTVDLQQKDFKWVEILVNAEHKHDFVAHAEAEDILVAVTAAIEKMKHQINHYKEKIQDHRRAPSYGGPDVHK